MYSSQPLLFCVAFKVNEGVGDPEEVSQTTANRAHTAAVAARGGSSGADSRRRRKLPAWMSGGGKPGASLPLDSNFNVRSFLSVPLLTLLYFEVILLYLVASGDVKCSVNSLC